MAPVSVGTHRMCAVAVMVLLKLDNGKEEIITRTEQPI